MGNQHHCYHLSLQPNPSFHFQKGDRSLNSYIFQTGQSEQVQSQSSTLRKSKINSQFTFQLNNNQSQQIPVKLQRKSEHQEDHIDKYISLNDDNQNEQLQQNSKEPLSGILSNIFQSSKDNEKSRSRKLIDVSSESRIQILVQTQQKQIKLQRPYISPQVLKKAQQLKIIKDQNIQDQKYYKKGDSFYQGQLNQEQKLHGSGCLYKTNGSLYVGSFKNGLAQGKGTFVFDDGSYYQGLFKDNMANDEKGFYQSQHSNYTGSFKDNLFHGNGSEKGQQFTFKGQYKNGKKHFGRLKWKKDKIDCIYEGYFDENQQFQGEGTLVEPSGMYKGEFKEGIKHGRGIYYFRSKKIKYEGNYKFGLKNGHGTISFFNNQYEFQRVYEGFFINDKPDMNGKQKQKLIDGLEY